MAMCVIEINTDYGGIEKYTAPSQRGLDDKASVVDTLFLSSKVGLNLI